MPPEERRRRLDAAVGSWATQGWAVESQTGDSAVLRRGGDLMVVSIDPARPGQLPADRGPVDGGRRQAPRTGRRSHTRSAERRSPAPARCRGGTPKGEASVDQAVHLPTFQTGPSFVGFSLRPLSLDL